MWTDVIDRLREQIQQRLDQLATEADRLRNALAALDPRGSSKETKASAAKPPPPKSASVRRQVARPAAGSARRTALGATKASVLAALAGGEAMTAAEVAAKTGLARGTVSTTLSRLANSGEVQKARRGYRLPPPGRSGE
jgi:CRP-like cAMP-binding protein